MQKLEGIHFYINIRNFNDIIIHEESRTGTVTHAIHALDTYFTSIETYAKSHYPKTLVVEKITGARLHMYIVDAVTPAYEAVKTISVAPHLLCKPLLRWLRGTGAKLAFAPLAAN